ncbi:MAG: phenylalanine--tRNA ligase subunit beta [Rickettsiales bacterium]
MKFTLSWLKEFLDTNASVAEISAKLTALGLEVESVEDKSETLKAFTVAEILAAEKHPDADRLRVCQVLTHAGERQIVCGAPNARAGIKVILADIGVTIPNGNFVIKKSKIRGVESNGMLCSAAELGLGENSDGIVELPANAKVGDSIVSVLGLDDPLFDIAITPNRGDCLGVYGIARDLAASGIGTLKPYTTKAVKGSGTAGRGILLKTDNCRMFVGRLISGVKNGPSPEWLQKKLKAVGLRPISALVDITNYMTIAFGRPLHVYDADKLNGDIIVRHSNGGESLKALNDKTYILAPGLCVIADEKNTLGLGGVVGGTESGCTEETKNVFLEAAWFEPAAIAKTGRALQIDSDARYRFERTVDPEFVIPGAEIATQMILDLCGGAASELVVAGTPPKLNKLISFSPDSVAHIGGVKQDEATTQTILEHLGFAIEKRNGVWDILPPSWRPEMSHEADLVEEVLRVRGYDAIPNTPLPHTAAPLHDDAAMKERSLRRLLAARGLSECHHFAFVPREHAERFAGGQALITVANPINAEMDTMRPSLLPALLSATKRNMDRGTFSLSLFELGSTFFGLNPEAQPTYAAGIRSGNAPQSWEGKPRALDCFDAKADLYAALDAMGIDGEKLKISAAAEWYHPGKSASLGFAPNKPVAQFGAIHPAILRLFGIDQEAVAFEINLSALPEKKKKAPEAIKLSDFQSSVRDFAFIVDTTVAAGELLAAIKKTEQGLIREVTLFDVYQGKGIPEDKKSLAISVTLQADDRTLSEADLSQASDKIIKIAKEQFKAELRA